MKLFSLSVVFITFFITISVQSQSVDYSKVDAHALSTPSRFEANTDELAYYLTSPFRSQPEKARAIFRWITDRIEYDADSFFRRVQPNSDPEYLLKSRTAICTGYAILFKELAEKAGLESIIIEGHSKGYGFNPEEDSYKVNHAWNAVKVDGYWKLLDTTWGAGYIDSETGQFKKRFEGHYFFTDPTQFIFDHFPEDSNWQLLYPPVSIDDYKQKVLLKAGFFNNGLSLLSHTESTIEASGSSQIKIQVPTDQVVTAQLSRNGVPVPGNQVFTNHRDKAAVIEVQPPQRGTYELEIFSRRLKSDDKSFSMVLSYQIKNNRETADSGFPEIFGKFLEQRGSVDHPMTYVIQADKEIKFSLTVDGAKSVSVVSGGEWIDLKKNGNHFSGLVIPKAGTVHVAANFNDDEQYSVLLEYQAR